MEKITKKMYFEAIKSAMTTGETAIDPALIAEFCTKEIAALEAKAAKAKTRAAAKKEADPLMDVVKAALPTDEFLSIADIAEVVAETDPDATVSKVTYRLTKLVEAGVAEKTQISVPTADGKSRKCQGYRLIAD